MAGALMIGCELADTAERAAEEQSDTQSNASTAGSESGGTASTGASSTNAWASIEWKGQSCAGEVQVMTLTAEITSNREFVNFTFSTYPWSDAGLVHFFVWQGDHWQGGKFDWIRKGGQSVKGLENIYGGYNGLSAPASGTRVAFAWTSADGDTRSNLAETVWP
jgi:hypothetical protein